MQLRSYEAHIDQTAVYRLWQRTVGSIWSLAEHAFQMIIVPDGGYTPGDHQVFEHNGEIVGFVATRTNKSSVHGEGVGSILLLMVAPEHQRKGVGQALLQAAISQLKARRATKVQLGAGAGSYFWPGVPSNLPAAVQFFEACRWKYTELSFDLVMELDNYITPLKVFSRIEHTGIKLAQATSIDAEAILKFEAECFPDWHQYFELAIKHREFKDILIAYDNDDAILGTVLVSDKQSNWENNGILWQQLFGNNAGAIGCLGVAERARGNGIGLGMAAQATEILKARGAKISYVAWTWLVDWYGQLGYRVWREYKMGSKNLIAGNSIIESSSVGDASYDRG